MTRPEPPADVDDPEPADPRPPAADPSPPVSAAFTDLPLTAPTLATLAAQGFVRPTPIQQAALAALPGGRDAIGVAATGTGKTLAFGLPLIERMAAGAIDRALVVAPTRELAVQIADHLEPAASAHGLEVARLVGGVRTGPQRRRLTTGARLLVGTPGRVLDHLEFDPALAEEVGALVLDEADRLLDMGFEEQVLALVDALPADRQTLLFSATFPEAVETVARRALRDPLRLEVDRTGTVARGAVQRVLVVPRLEKLAFLLWLLSSLRGPTLVFVRTRQRAVRLRSHLRRARHRVECLHGDLTPAQRREALARLGRGAVRVLVATNLAARGLDLDAIEHVVNYDVPEAPEDYVHRVGRTARMEREGWATTLADPEELPRLRRIERLTGVPLALVPGPEDKEPWCARARSVAAPRPPGGPASRGAAARGPARGSGAKGASGKLKRRLKTKAKARAKAKAKGRPAPRDDGAGGRGRVGP